MYEMIVTVERVVTESFKVNIAADDEQEAQDIAYDFFVTYPEGTVPPERVLKTSEDTQSTEILDMSFVSVADKVFNSNDDGGDEIA